jgi:hypothetical protein
VRQTHILHPPNRKAVVLDAVNLRDKSDVNESWISFFPILQFTAWVAEQCPRRYYQSPTRTLRPPCRYDLTNAYH